MGEYMDTKVEQRLDSIVEDEMQKGYRIKELPAEYVSALKDSGGRTLEYVRFTRVNPARRRKINELVQRLYNKDLRDPDILSHAQLLELVQKRGEWTPEMEKELKDLERNTNRELGELYAQGMVNNDWGVQLLSLADNFREMLHKHITDPEKLRTEMDRFNRWVEFNVDRQEEYNEKHASAQGKKVYNVDIDHQRLMNAVSTSPEAVDLLYEVDSLRDRLHKFMELQKRRLRLAELQLRSLKIFSESAEQRRDTNEEMARLYFTTESVTKDGEPKGPIAKTFEDMWDFPEDVIQWLLLEAYFFQNGIPDVAREYLEGFGFTKAVRASETSSSPNGETELSDELPVPQNSSSATDRLKEMDAAYSA